MKTALALLAGIVALGISAPAGAASTEKTAQTGRPAQAQNFSAARKHYRHHWSGERRHDGYVRHGYGGAYASDPSIGYYPNIRRYQRMRRCVIDLGYGRFQLCN